ncbi:unnamed protein product [Clonostachys solani]|uniref:Secreted protein n=1 Tax=Clonostachys solani TaxID=160281 RepID=A0A9P0EQ20_9HYPO|nr:unnamed protein product [Clonostachys solani]
MVAIKHFSVASLMWLGLASYGLATHQENPRGLDKLDERQLDELEVRDLEERGRNLPTPSSSHGGGPRRGGKKIVKRGRN